ncbi:MAG: ABC transporter substrate-binding protein [Pleomorphochaeta sp.]
MKKQLFCLFALIGVVNMLFANGEHEVVVDSTKEIVEIVDDNGDTTSLEVNPERVVITDIYPLASVLTVFLDSADTLVGIHPVSMSAAKSGLLGELYPSILDVDTSFMTGSDLNVEQLMLLKPDVVLYNASKKAQGEMIRNAGIKAIGVSAVKWDYDVLKTYRKWTNILSQLYPDQISVSQKVDEYSINTKELISKRVANISKEEQNSVLFLFNYDDKKIITSGKHFFGQWWANAVGAKNIAEEINIDNSNAIINMEQIYAWNPDVIFITNFTPALPKDLYTNAISNDDWSNVAAVQNNTVYKLPLGSYRSYTPGVDTPITLLWMAKKVYPELFSDINIEDETRSYYELLYNIELSDEQIYQMFNSTREAANGYSKL